MPSYYGPDFSDSDSDEAPKVKRDEYGDIFEDYGFLKRAEDYKEKGNAEFKKERFERALREYDSSLEQLLTVAYDKSIVIGKQKWNDVVVLRSMIHLNKSACHYKVEEWQKSLDEAMECLMGNVRDEQMFTDPHIRAKVKQSERKTGQQSVTLVESRLPRVTRAKAWFRVSRCHANLSNFEHAKEAMAKALEMCEDPQLLAEMSQHSLRLDALERQQKDRQKQKFRGFWDKLQDRGGYMEAKVEKQARWDSLNYEEKFNKVQELDDSDGDDEMPPVFRPPPRSENIQEAQEVQVALEESLQSSLPDSARIEPASIGLDRAKAQAVQQSFEDYLSGKSTQPEGTRAAALDSSDPFAAAPASGRTAVGDSVPAHPGPGDAAEVWARRQEESNRKEREWRAAQGQSKRSQVEDDELRIARERVAQQRQQRASGLARRRLEELDDSEDSS